MITTLVEKLNDERIETLTENTLLREKTSQQEKQIHILTSNLTIEKYNELQLQYDHLEKKYHHQNELYQQLQSQLQLLQSLNDDNEKENHILNHTLQNMKLYYEELSYDNEYEMLQKLHYELGSYAYKRTIYHTDDGKRSTVMVNFYNNG
jgi:hypothetical protein